MKSIIWVSFSKSGKSIKAATRTKQSADQVKFVAAAADEKPAKKAPAKRKRAKAKRAAAPEVHASGLPVVKRGPGRPRKVPEATAPAQPAQPAYVAPPGFVVAQITQAEAEMLASMRAPAPQASHVVQEEAPQATGTNG